MQVQLNFCTIEVFCQTSSHQIRFCDIKQSGGTDAKCAKS